MIEPAKIVAENVGVDGANNLFHVFLVLFKEAACLHR